LAQRLPSLRSELLSEEYEDDELRELDEVIQTLEERISLP
jgi:hypothetical protein